jgi:hypothetical protein
LTLSHLVHVLAELGGKVTQPSVHPRLELFSLECLSLGNGRDLLILEHFSGMGEFSSRGIV